MPLRHEPGEAQVDFGHALVKFQGELIKVAFFAMALPHSDALFVMAYPREWSSIPFCSRKMSGHCGYCSQSASCPCVNSARRIFWASRSEISVCLGTASMCPVSGLHHKECGAPSRFRKQPDRRKILRRASRFIQL